MESKKKKNPPNNLFNIQPNTSQTTQQLMAMLINCNMSSNLPSLNAPHTNEDVNTQDIAIKSPSNNTKNPNIVKNSRSNSSRETGHDHISLPHSPYYSHSQSKAPQSSNKQSTFQTQAKAKQDYNNLTQPNLNHFSSPRVTNNQPPLKAPNSSHTKIPMESPNSTDNSLSSNQSHANTPRKSTKKKTSKTESVFKLSKKSSIPFDSNLQTLQKQDYVIPSSQRNFTDLTIKANDMNQKSIAISPHLSKSHNKVSINSKSSLEEINPIDNRRGNTEFGRHARNFALPIWMKSPNPDLIPFPKDNFFIDSRVQNIRIVAA